MRGMMLWEPERLELLDLPLRPLRPGEVRLRVTACSICGSDLEGYHGQHPKLLLPRVLGHEMACTVAELGPGVSVPRLGERVVPALGPSCGGCAACREGRSDQCASPLSTGFTADGAYAEYMIALARGCTPIPEGVTAIEAAVAQPAGIANHAVATRANVQAGETVLVQGCGPIGLCAMLLARLRGATVISTDVVPYRCALARDLGADLALDAHRDDVLAAVRGLTQGRGADKVIECVGSDQDKTLPQAIACLRPGGLVTVVGSFAHNRATLPIIDFKFNEKSLIGSQSMPEGYGPIFGLLLSGQLDLDRLVSHRLPLERLEHGLKLMDAKAERVMKVVVEP